jgi:hypothetical protein
LQFDPPLPIAVIQWAEVIGVVVEVTWLEQFPEVCPGALLQSVILI